MARKSPSPPGRNLREVQDFAGDLCAEARSLVARFLDHSDRPSQVSALTNATRNLILQAIQRSPDFGRHECRAGCAFCCHTAVTVAPPEALTIMAYLREHHEPDRLAEVRQHIEANAERARQMTYLEYVSSNTRCALLTESGECRVHPVRPLACAGFLSTSRAACEAEFNRLSGRASVPIDRFAMLAGLSLSYGLKEACQNVGVDGEFYELHHALRCIWDRPDASQAWASGQTPFTGCLRASTW